MVIQANNDQKRDLPFTKIFRAIAKNIDGYIALLLVDPLSYFQGDSGVILPDIVEDVWCAARERLFAHCNDKESMRS
jgi:hypothetical protein